MAPERADDHDGKTVGCIKVSSEMNHATELGMQNERFVNPLTSRRADIPFQKLEISFDQLFKYEVELKVVKSHSFQIAVACT